MEPSLDGFSVWQVKGCMITLPNRYQVQHELGAGTGGIVCQCEDRLENRKVAVKIVTKPLTNPMAAIRVLRELKVMRHLHACTPIVTMYSAFRCGQTVQNPWGGVYIVMELMDTDFGDIIRSGMVSTEHVPYFTLQILQGLKYMHSCGIMHRDLKPQNVLYNSEESTVKIGDFGSARDADSAQTAQVVTLWYRAPELLLGLPYTEAVDIFSVGCILGELIKSCHMDKTVLASTPKSAVLFPGMNYMEQLKLIIPLVGLSHEDIEAVESPATRDRLKTIVNANAHQQQEWASTFPCIAPDEEALLRALLHFNPRKRPTAKEAITHPYLNEWVDDEEEELALPEFQADYENLTDLTLIHAELNKELEVYHSDPALAPAPNMMGAGAGAGGALAPNMSIDL